ncbi:MAG: META domain-containing protein [Chloroflexi bacterium]|nr:META domain-containing protein [Chloroflexota bacterium]
MRFKWLILALLLLAFAFPALAQDTGLTQVTFDGVTFSLPSALATNVNIVQYAGGDETTFPPEAPHTRFYLYNGFPAAPQSLFDQGAVLTVYRTADLAGNAEAEAALQQLQTLLNDRPDLTPYMTVADDGSGQTLPFLPAIAAGQVIRARVQYVDTPAMSGISYITVYRQDVSPFTGGEFIYTFQGLSQDGQYYVSAILNIDTTLFPAELEAFDPTTFNAAEYYNQSVQQLNEAGEEAFTPAPSALEPVLLSLTFLDMANPAATPEATPTDTTTDPTLGGLAGTWTLVSWGPVDAPTAALPNAPVTLTFATTGVTGSGGCNTFGGSFEYNANVISFRDVATTLIACEQPVMDQETAFFNALNTASAFQITGDQLQITYDGGVLTFTRAA